MSRRSWAVIFFAAALLLFAGVRYRLAQMDDWLVDIIRFERRARDDAERPPWPAIRFSWPALKGLTLYLAGADAAAARAYREHFKTYGEFGTLGGPMEAALMRGQPQVARRLAEEALAKNKENRQGLLTLGRLALDEGRGDEALAYFSRVLNRFEDQLDALLLSAVAHTRAGQNDSAIDTLKRALRDWRGPPRPSTFLAVLETSGDLGQLPVGQKPLCLLAHYHRFLRIYDDAQGPVAIEYARQAIAAGDRPDDAWLTIGIIYGFLGRSEDSREALAKAVAVNPRNPDALLRAALVYGESGDPATERRMMMEAAELGGDDPYYTSGLQHYLVEKLGDYQQAREYFLRRLTKNPNSAGDLRRLGQISSLLGDQPQAIAYFRRALALRPDQPETLERLARALYEMGQLDEAKETIDKAIVLDPRRGTAYATLGFIYLRQEKKAMAIQTLERANWFGGLDIGQYADLCWLYSVQGAHERAVPCLRWVLRQRPEDPVVRARVGMAEQGLARQRARGSAR
ncbi:MAG: tetratricopeptide repeat protein [Thermoanaerobaculia bacterium]